MASGVSGKHHRCADEAPLSYGWVSVTPSHSDHHEDSDGREASEEEKLASNQEMRGTESPVAAPLPPVARGRLPFLSGDDRAAPSTPLDPTQPQEPFVGAHFARMPRSDRPVSALIGRACSHRWCQVLVLGEKEEPL